MRIAPAALLFCAAACDGAVTALPPAPGPRIAVRDDFESPNPKWRTIEGTWERRSGLLAQTSTDHAFNVALLEERRFTDVDVTVRFRPLSGERDASGGIVLRATDGRNYLLVRANALEENVRLYTVVDGRRRQIATAAVKAPAMGAWHALRVVAAGDRIEAHLDGVRLLDHSGTPVGSGWVGLWTKEDSVTEFDDFVAEGP